MVWLLGRTNIKRNWVDPLNFEPETKKEEALKRIWPLTAVIIGQYYNYFQGDLDDLRAIGLLSVWESIENNELYSDTIYGLHCDLRTAVRKETKYNNPPLVAAEVRERIDLDPMFAKCENKLQREVLRGLYEGFTCQQMSEKLSYSPSSISVVLERLRDIL